MTESASSYIPVEDDIDLSEWVLLSKTQKKRRKAKAKGKEINKGINVRVGYPDGYMKDN